MTEFALVLPILTLLLFGVIQFGLVFNNYLTMTDAVRAGARKGAVGRHLSDPQGEATAAVRAAATDLGVVGSERQRQRISRLDAWRRGNRRGGLPVPNQLAGPRPALRPNAQHNEREGGMNSNRYQRGQAMVLSLVLHDRTPRDGRCGHRCWCVVPRTPPDAGHCRRVGPGRRDQPSG